jgi:hypothetical protein
MGRVSSVKLLTKELRELISDLHDGGVTLDQILAKLRELGVDSISRSALARYTVDIDKVGERLRRSRDMAEVLVKGLGKAPESQTAQLNLELMHSALFDLLAGGEDGEGLQLDPKEAAFLAGALKDLAGAQKTQADFVFKVRQETAKAVKTEVATAVDSIARQQGLTAETVMAIKAKILGVKVPDAHA